jgi:membrane protease YdiL (CAAX protease family)
MIKVTSRRNFAPWLLLSLLFFLSIVGALSQYLMSDQAADSVPTYSQELLQLDVLTSLRQVSPAAASAGMSNNWKDLANGIEPKSKSDELGWRLKAAFLREGKTPIPSSVLRRLKSLESGELWLKIYGESKLTTNEAMDLVNRITEPGTINTIAKVHALEKAGDRKARNRLISPARVYKLMVAGFVVFGILGLGVIAWIAFLLTVRSGQAKPLGLAADTSTPENQDRLATLAVALFGGFIAFSGVAPFLTQAIPITPTILTGILMIGWVFLVLRMAKLQLSQIGLGRANLGRHVGIGFMAFAMELPVAGLLAIIGTQVLRFLPTPSHPASNALMNNPTPIVIVSMLFLAVIVAPFWEEVMFRGLLFPALTGWTGRVIASGITSSLLFAMIHPQGIPIWLALSAIGGASCIVSYWTKSLVPSIVMHACHNGTLMLLTIAIFV